MQQLLTPGRRLFLSADLAGRREMLFALGAVLVSVLFFFAVVPFVTRPVARVPAFIPAYESALVICYLITAVLLYGQYTFSRSRALLLLASGYLFTAFIVVAHTLAFPGVFSSGGLLGSGAQSSVWLYAFWHAGFPLFVLAYAVLGDPKREATESAAPGPLERDKTLAPVLVSAALVLVIASCLALAATAGHALLPELLLDDHATPALTAIGVTFSIFSLLALLGLWRRRPHTILDLWLMVVMCAWLFEVALFVVFNTARFDLGWYAARLYGLCAASSLLIVLLVETSTQNARLAQLTAELSIANRSLEQLSLHDALTALANRRFFDAYLAAQIAVARRHGRTLALVMCDADAFKDYNDEYGHQAGDECLRKIANALQSCCRRPADMAARYGGEEFALILPDTELGNAVSIAEAAREAVAALEIPHARSPVGPHMSISGGVAFLNDDMTAQQLISAADQNLFKAKRLGRDRVVS